jgi:hypothetical protein
MKSILIANIGNRDVWVDQAAPISGEVNPQWNMSASRRALGAELLADWSRCRPHLTLPIIGKAADYVRQQPGGLEGVVLISSDQSGRSDVADHHLAQDSCELAPVVERLLVEEYDLTPGATIHWTVEGNPADYAVMQAFLRQRLAGLYEEEPESTFYLEVSGGTPAMTSMLLVAGAEILGLAARPLYVSEHEEQPFALDLGHRLVAESLLRVVQEDVSIYAYHAAAQTVRGNLELVREYVRADDLLATLDHARHRRNLDFEDAWNVTRQATAPQWRQRLQRIAADTETPTREMLLRESIHHAQIAFDNRNLLDLVVRVFQFVEGVWRYLALEAGVQFEHNGKPNPDGKELAAGWLQSHQPLVRTLKEHGVRLDTVNRYVLERIVLALQEPPDDDRRRDMLDLLRKLEAIGDLRNRAVHQYHRLSLALLRDTFFPRKRDRKKHPPEDAQEVLRAMERVWSAATGQPFDSPSPYQAINALCEELTRPSVQ